MKILFRIVILTICRALVSACLKKETATTL